MKIIKGLPPAPIDKETVALDVETFGQTSDKLHRPTGSFACLSIAARSYGDKVYQIYDHNDVKKVLNIAKKGEWAFHNSLYDIRQLMRYSKRRPLIPIWDTLIIDRLLYGGLYSTFSLGDLSRRHLQKKMDKDVRDDFSSLTEMTPGMREYAARDVARLLDIVDAQKANMDDGSQKIYDLIDQPAIWAILDMPPVKVDVDAWLKLSEKHAHEASIIETDLGTNVKSNPQVLKLVQAQTGIVMKNTQRKTLDSHLNDHPVFQAIIDGRMYRDAVSRYGEKWVNKHVEDDGMVYSNWGVIGAATGRMKSSDPNLQQIPSRRLPIFRQMFVSKYGGKMVIADVSQQEPRITAFETQDPGLIKAIHAKEDLHLYVTRQIYGDDTIKKSDPRRSNGKDINLGLTYGLTPHGLAARTEMNEQEAEILVNAYFQRFPHVRQWMERQRQIANRRNYVTTANGRRGWVNMYDKHWQNNVINMPIQGGAADHTKLSLVLAKEMAKDDGLDFDICLVIHDELVADAPTGTVVGWKKIMRDAFTEAADQLYPDIPFVTDVVSGDSWGAK